MTHPDGEADPRLCQQQLSEELQAGHIALEGGGVCVSAVITINIPIPILILISA